MTDPQRREYLVDTADVESMHSSLLKLIGAGENGGPTARD
jgi:hypothetical protein